MEGREEVPSGKGTGNGREAGVGEGEEAWRGVLGEGEDGGNMLGEEKWMLKGEEGAEKMKGRQRGGWEGLGGAEIVEPTEVKEEGEETGVVVNQGWVRIDVDVGFSSLNLDSLK